MVNQQPSPGATLTLGPTADPLSEKPPPEPPNPPLPPENPQSYGRENPVRSTPLAMPGRNQEQNLVTSLDEAHAPFKYASKGSFNYNGTFTDAEDPKTLFNNSAKLVIATLQGGPHAPTTPSNPPLLDAADWADLSCALLAAIGRGYALQYDKDQAAAPLKKEWTEAPDPYPLSPRYPTLFHRLSATADSLNDQLLIDAQDDETNIVGWIIEAKSSILKAETANIKAQVQEDWRQWRTEQLMSLAAAQERDIAEAVQKRNASYFRKAAAELGLHLSTSAQPPPQAPPALPNSMPRGVKRMASGSAPSTEPTTPRKQKINPSREARRAPTPTATPRGRPDFPADTAHPPRWVDPSPTPQPKKQDHPAPHAVLNLSPKVTLNLGPKVSTTSTAGTSQLDTAAILAAIKLAMAPIATRLAALERSTMPPPGAKVGRPRHLSEQSDQHGQDAPQADPPEPGAQGEEDFTVVARTGKGRRSRGKANVTGQVLEQARQANPTLTSYAGAAAAAANIPQPPAQRKGSSPPPSITEVTILRSGGLIEAQKETQIRQRAADAIVREVRLKMAKATANPIRLRAGRWSINPRSRGNFVYSFDGNIPFDIIKSYEHILLAPLGNVGELCPSMGWTRFLTNGVPVWEEDGLTPFSTEALLEEVRALPGLKKVYFAMQPRWLTHPERIYTDYSSVTFAISDPDGSTSATLINNRAALFGKEVTIRRWIDKPAFIQCTRCHALGHNKASKVCTLGKDLVRCFKCGGAHSSDEHDKRCPRKHQVAGICDCKHKCLNCHNHGHNCRDPRCPARDQYRPRNARKPRKGKEKVKPMELENNDYDLEYNHWGPDDEWNDEIPGHSLSNFIREAAPPPEPPAPTHLTTEPLQTPGTQEELAPAAATTSPTDSQTMNIDYDVLDPITNRPAIYDDPFAGGEAPTPAAYSPSCLNKAATPPTHA